MFYNNVGLVFSVFGVVILSKARFLSFMREVSAW